MLSRAFTRAARVCTQGGAPGPTAHIASFSRLAAFCVEIKPSLPTMPIGPAFTNSLQSQSIKRDSYLCMNTVLLLF